MAYVRGYESETCWDVPRSADNCYTAGEEFGLFLRECTHDQEAVDERTARWDLVQRSGALSATIAARFPLCRDDRRAGADPRRLFQHAKRGESGNCRFGLAC